MEENVRILVFRGVPKALSMYIMGKNDYTRTPIKVFVDNQGDHDLTIEVAKDRHHKVREYIYGLIDGYLLANQPEG